MALLGGISIVSSLGLLQTTLLRTVLCMSVGDYMWAFLLAEILPLGVELLGPSRWDSALECSSGLTSIPTILASSAISYFSKLSRCVLVHGEFHIDFPSD